MLTKPEIYIITNSYIGVNAGYLGDFSYSTHDEFYPYFCDLDICPSSIEGTTRTRFINILENSDASTQAKILKGVLKKYPLEYFPEEFRAIKQRIFFKIEELINRLEGGLSVINEQLIVTNSTVERAILDTKVLIENNGATSGVDRIHTALHGYLREVCKQGNIECSEEETLTQVFKKLKSKHPHYKMVVQDKMILTI